MKSKTKRVQFDLSPAYIESLDALGDDIGATSRKDIVNTAVSLLKWAVKETRDRRLITSFDPDTQKYKELSMTWMDGVRGTD